MNTTSSPHPKSLSLMERDFKTSLTVSLSFALREKGLGDEGKRRRLFLYNLG